MGPDANCPSLVSRFFLTTLFLCSYSLNITFLYLIRKHSSVIIRPYKRVLVVSAIGDMLCAACFALVIVYPHTIDFEQRKLTLLSFDGLVPQLLYSQFGPFGLYYSIGILEACACFVAGYNCVPFVYRYIFVCCNYKVSYFQFFLMICVVALMSLSITGSSLYLNISNQKANFAQEYMWGETKDCLPLMVSPDTKSRYPDAFSQVMRVVFYSSSYFILASYGLTMFFGWQISKFLRSKDCLPSVSRYNNQMSMTLAIQALSPILAVGIPGFIANASFFFGYKLSFAYKWAALGIALIPIINPLSAMLLLTCYRRALFPRWFTRNKNRRTLTKSLSVA